MVPGVVVRDAQDTELDALRDVMDVAFHRETTAEQRARMMPWTTLRPVVAVEGDAVVGTAGAWPFTVSVPGGVLPLAGVTVVTVLPTHRRRGILRAMMDHVVADARDRGEPLAGLWASEGTIYGRFGYGPATWVRDQRASLAGGLGLHEAMGPGAGDGAGTGGPATAAGDDATGGPATAGGQGGPDPLAPRLLHPRDAHPVLAPIFERARARRGGLMSRDEPWWTHRMLGDQPEERHGAGPLRVVVVGDDGYALYRVREGEATGPVEAHTTVEVEELVGATAEAERALLRFVSRIDLADELLLAGRPADDALAQVALDVRGFAGGRSNDALWLRILDLPAAVAGRAWATEVDLVLEIAHPGDALVAGRWALRGGPGGPGSARAERTDAPADLAMHARELGSLYLGGVGATTLRDAGLVDERTPGAASALDAALRVDRAPWTAGVF